MTRVSELNYNSGVAAGLLFPNLYDIRNYGASNVPGFDNQPAFARASTAAQNAGGGIIYIPPAPNPWQFGSALILHANVYVYLMGTLQALPSCVSAGIQATNQSNVGVFGSGTVDMNSSQTVNGGSTSAQQGIVFKVNNGSTNLVNLFITGMLLVVNCWQRGIEVSAGNAGSTLTHARIGEGVKVSNTGDNGFLVSCVGNADGTTQSTSQDITIDGITVNSPGSNGLQVRGCSNVNVSHVRAYGNGTATGHGVVFGAGGDSTETTHVTDFTLDDVVAQGFTGAGSWGIALSARCKRFTLGNIVCTGNAGGLSVDLTTSDQPLVAQLSDGTVHDAVLANNLTSHGMNINHVDGLQLSNIKCRGNGDSGLAISNSVGVTGASIQTVGNTTHGLVLFGTNAGTGGHAFVASRSSGNGTDQYNTAALPIGSTLNSTTPFVTA